MPERLYRADLHIHSVLSPCAERDMIPHCIILEALEKGLEIIAVTDHNSSENVKVSMALGEQFGIWVIPGMEIETKEEIHFLTFFPTYDRLERFYGFMQRYNQPIPLDEQIWGEEWVIDDQGQIVEKKDYLLAYPLSLSVEDLFELVVDHRGIIIPSHVDHRTYSLIGVLGFVPPYLDFPVLEISSSISPAQAMQKYSLRRHRLVQFSDAHILSQIGLVYTNFYMGDRNWNEFEKAIYQLDGRDVFPIV